MIYVVALSPPYVCFKNHFHYSAMQTPTAYNGRFMEAKSVTSFHFFFLQIISSEKKKRCAFSRSFTLCIFEGFSSNALKASENHNET